LGGNVLESIVGELQREAINSNSNISDLLRKAYFVARKLKVEDFQQWTTQELNGYDCPMSDIPEYREIVGSLMFYNPHRGWIPAVISDEETANLVSKYRLGQSVTQLLDLVIDEQGFGLRVPMNQGMSNSLANFFRQDLERVGLYGGAQFSLKFGKSQVQGIIDTIRNIVLEWSMKLEEDGIMGEGLSFNQKEKEEANRQNYTVNNFYGNTNGVQIQQNSPNSTQTMNNGMDIGQVTDFITKLKENLKQVGLPEEQQTAVESEIEAISNELLSVQPKPSVIKKSLSIVGSILEKATASLIASGLLHELGKIHI
jgi:hypothetical protein